jgi:phosphate-selective porin OprO and OprP
MTKNIWTCFAAPIAMIVAGTVPAQAQDAPQPPTAQQVEVLQKQVEALQAQLDALKKQLPKAVPNWRGAPQLSDADGWSFKPRGRIHYDVGYIAAPGAYAANRNLGFNSRMRRVRLGVEGTMPGGFGYKVETDLGDVLASWTNKDKNLLVRVGNFETLDGLDQISSSNFITFLERGQMNDAFSNTRRLGAAAALLGKEDAYRLEAGLFTAHSIDASFDNDGWIGAARGVYAPQIGSGRLHLAANYQHRAFQQNNGGTASLSTNAPSLNQVARYRARPFLQTTDVRFVDTGNFAARGDDIFGLELAAIFPKIYVASEAQWAKVRTYRPGDISTGLDAFANASQVTPRQNPNFFGGYVELGYFLTGETRGYKDNVWGRTKVLNPLSKGGAGAWQVAARLDYLDLDSQSLTTAPLNNFTTGVSSSVAPSTALARGGKQTGAIFGLNWYPSDYARIMVNYIRVNVDGGPLAASVLPASTAPVDQRGYSTDAFAIRTQLDF